MGSFVRRVTTASGATAVQIVHKKGRTVLGIEHIGSAHDDAQLGALLRVAQERLHAGQALLPFEPASAGGRPVGQAVVEGTASLIVWDALRGVFDALGFNAVKDEAFTSLVLGRIIEPTSKADTVRVLTELGVSAPSRVTFMRCLKRVVEWDYRQVLADACFAHATRDDALALVLYDVTTLYFEPSTRTACARSG